VEGRASAAGMPVVATLLPASVAAAGPVTGAGVAVAAGANAVVSGAWVESEVGTSEGAAWMIGATAGEAAAAAATGGTP